MYLLYNLGRDILRGGNMKKFINKLLVENTDDGIIQFIRYFFVGGIAAVVNISLLFILTDIFNFNYVISNIIAFTMGLIVNYTLSVKFVFTNNNSMNRVYEFIMHFIIGVLGLVIDTCMLWLFTSKLKIYYMISKIISTMITFIWNFVARKIFYKINFKK